MAAAKYLFARIRWSIINIRLDKKLLLLSLVSCGGVDWVVNTLRPGLFDQGAAVETWSNSIMKQLDSIDAGA